MKLQQMKTTTSINQNQVFVILNCILIKIQKATTKLHDTIEIKNHFNIIFDIFFFYK